MANTVLISGHLVYDTKSGETKNGKAWASNSLGVKRKFIDGDDRFVLKAWGETAEKLRVQAKGSQFLITGELGTDSWKDKSDEWVSQVVVNVRHIEPIGASVVVAGNEDADEDSTPF